METAKRRKNNNNYDQKLSILSKTRCKIVRLSFGQEPVKKKITLFIKVSTRQTSISVLLIDSYFVL